SYVLNTPLAITFDGGPNTDGVGVLGLTGDTTFNLTGQSITANGKITTFTNIENFGAGSSGGSRTYTISSIFPGQIVYIGDNDNQNDTVNVVSGGIGADIVFGSGNGTDTMIVANAYLGTIQYYNPSDINP